MAPTGGGQLSQKPIPVFTPKSITSTSYAVIIQKYSTPKRDQGLILDCVEDLNLTDFTIAVGDIVQPINILSASRISKNRVCLFLSRKELVTEITDKHQSLRINDFNVHKTSDKQTQTYNFLECSNKHTKPYI